jgi:hypothetical protein
MKPVISLQLFSNIFREINADIDGINEKFNEIKNDITIQTIVIFFYLYERSICVTGTVEIPSDWFHNGIASRVKVRVSI